MKGDIVPDGDHVLRYCGGSHVRSDGTVSESAFRLRPGESYLSVNWIEFFERDPDAALADIRRVLAAKLRVGGAARLARINVGGMRSMADRSKGVALTVLHEPVEMAGAPNDPSHCGIHGMAADDDDTPNLIARSVLDVMSAREV